MINPTLESSSRRFILTVFLVKARGCMLFFLHAQKWYCSANRNVKVARQGTLPQQLLHALTNNKWINKWQPRKYAYIPMVHAYWQNSSTYRRMWWYKLPVRARWCRTGHKKINTLLQNKTKKPKTTMINIQTEDSCEGFLKDIYRQRCRCFRLTEKQWRTVPRGTIPQHDGLGWKPTQTRGSPTTDFNGPG